MNTPTILEDDSKSMMRIDGTARAACPNKSRDIETDKDSISQDLPLTQNNETPETDSK